MSNTFAIGDIHGCFFTLEKLLEKLPKDANLVFTGDLCDKGLHTKEVIDFVMSENHTVIKGNHESLMETFLMYSLDNELKNPWATEETFGGKHTIESYKDNPEKARKHIDFIKGLPHYEIIDNYFITHGFGLPYFKQRDSAARQIKSNRIGRKFPDWENWDDHDIINIFGHCDFEEVEKGQKYFGIDTGAAYGNKLTALELGTHKIIQQRTLDKDLIKGKK